MNWIKRNIELFIILILGFVLRFSISIYHTYSNDELSAINRLRYSNLPDLIEFGVMKGDMHPAGVQVFMKIWSLIGGTSELWMRLPFVLCGAASVFVIYILGWKWFNNKRVGIWSAAILATLYFPVINSEFARPYSPGLLVCLLVAWFFHKVLFCEVKKYKNAIFLGIAFASAMYIHYFAFLFVLFIGFTGLFFLKKDNYKLYLLSVGIAALLFLPHIQITLYHLSVGGLQWLGPPEWNWLFQFLHFTFNDSLFILAGLFILLMLSNFLRQDIPAYKHQYLWLCLTWFFGIYGIGHVFSLLSSPILKFPVMLFALPFFILPIGYFLSRLKFQSIWLTIALIGISASTILEKNLYGNQHFGLFSEIASQTISWQKEVSKEDAYLVFNINDPAYMNFYANQWGDTIQFDWNVLEFGDDMRLREDLQNRNETFCIVGYSARQTDIQVFETVLEFYPSLVEGYKFFNSGVFLFSKEVSGALSPQQGKWQDFYFKEMQENWTYFPDHIKSDSIGPYYLLDENLIYGPEFIFQLNEIENSDSVYIKVELIADLSVQGQLTITFSGERDGEIIQYLGENFWMGHDVEKQILTSVDHKGYYAFKIPNYLKEDDKLKISLWNRNGLPSKIRSYKIYLKKNSWN